MIMGDELKLDKILDFYDVPQLFIAKDKFGAQYICLLYDDSTVCKYTAVKISGERMRAFLEGKTELRDIYLHPENKDEYYEVVYSDNRFMAMPLADSALREDRLPDKGYTMDGGTQETMTVNLPIKDHGLFTELVNKFGWACL
jgi:hypothetical protein